MTIDENIKKAFKNGLIKASLNTKAWIITGGTDSGVNRLIGDSVKDILDKITVIGIANWGTIAFRKDLERSKINRNNDRYVVYFSNRKIEEKSVSLNPNHSHFLLVDDGSINEFGRAFKFRNDLIELLMKKYSNLVYLVIEGGYGTLENIYNVLKNKSSPVIIMEGTKGCCDLLIKAKNEISNNM